MGGRIVLKVLLVHFMEITLSVAFGSFLAGWFGRDFSAPRPTETINKCVCDCNWQGSATVGESGVQSSSSLWFIVVLLVC